MKFLINFFCFFIPVKKLRHKIRNFENYIITKRKNIKNHKQIANFLSKNYINKDLKYFPAIAKKDLGTQKIIWQFWGQGIDDEIPIIVKACLDSVQKNKDDYTVIVLTDKTIKDYIDIPDFIYEKLKNNNSFKYAFFSDLLRLYLLSAYGGIWIDATIYLTDKIPNHLLEKDFFMFQRGEKPDKPKTWEVSNIDYFSWDKNFKVRVMNSFIIAKPKNEMIDSLRNILVNYWKNETTFKNYFLFQILFNELIKTHKNCEIISDIPPHIMATNIFEQYSNKLWEKITNHNPIHKLTYFAKYPEDSIIQHILYEYNAMPYDILPKDLPENITFCTMCFNMGNGKIDKIKNANRTFENFYLKSLEKFITRYKKIVLWCDVETADFIKEKNLKVQTKIMNFSDLPFYKNREIYLQYLTEMKQKSFNQGYLLKDLKPEQVVDYLILVLSKIEVLKWAQDNDFYKSDYLYWMDAGTHNGIYTRFWKNWDGVFDIKTDKFKCCFMTEHKRIYKSLIDTTSYQDIALIKGPFEISASHLVIPNGLVDEFYATYHNAINFLNTQHMITTEQSVFSTMLKMGRSDLFELAKTNNYIDIVNLVTKSYTTNKIKNDKISNFKKKLLLKIVSLFNNQSFENKIRQKVVYKKKFRILKIFQVIKRS